MAKYEVVNGRFSMGGNTFEHGETLELNESEVKRLGVQGIIGETLEKFVEKKVEAKKATPKVPKADTKVDAPKAE